MYYHDKRLQFSITVEKADLALADTLQQAIDGVEREIRVCMKYFF